MEGIETDSIFSNNGIGDSTGVANLSVLQNARPSGLVWQANIFAARSF